MPSPTPQFHLTQPANHTGLFAFPTSSLSDPAKYTSPSPFTLPFTSQPTHSNPMIFPAYSNNQYPNPNPTSRSDPDHNISPFNSHFSHSYLPNNSAPNSSSATATQSSLTPIPTLVEAYRHPNHTSPTPKPPPFSSFTRPNSFNRGPTLASRPEYPRLSQSEIQTRIARGLCFRCGGKFGPNHQCPFKQLRLLLCDDDNPEVTEFSYEDRQPK